MKYPPIRTREAIATQTRDIMGAGGNGAIAGITTQYGMFSNSGQQSLLAAITSAVANDVGRLDWFEMRAYTTGKNPVDVTDTDPYCYALNVAGSSQFSATLLRSFYSLQLDWKGECYFLELPRPGGGITFAPFIQGRIFIKPAVYSPVQHNLDGSVAAIAGYRMFTNTGQLVGEYNSEGYPVMGNVQGRLWRTFYPFQGDIMRTNAYVLNAGIPIDIVEAYYSSIRSYLSNNGYPGLIAELPETATNAQVDEVERKLSSKWNDPTNKGTVGAIRGNIKITPVPDSTPNADWGSMEEAARAAVMETWNMPSTRLGRGESTGRALAGDRITSGSNTAMANYIINMPLHRLNMIANMLSMGSRATRGIEYKIVDLGTPALELENSYKVDRALKLYSGGLSTRDESRLLVNLEPALTGGQDFVTPVLATDPAGTDASSAPLRSAEQLILGPGDATPLARAVEKPHEFAKSLDAAITKQIARFGIAAQDHHVRVFKRVAGAIKHQTGAHAATLDTTPMPDITAASVFPVDQFNTELKKDLKTELTTTATLALPAFAALFGTAVSHDHTPASIAATQTTTRLVDGTSQVVGWNDAINRDLQTILGTARSNNLSVGDTLTKISNALGVQLETGAVPAADQQIGSRAFLIAQNASHQMTNTMANDIYAVQGVNTKVWQSMGDAVVREDHADADGQEVAVSDSFNVGGYDMDYPGDPSAPPSETYNCRCVIVPGSGSNDTTNTGE